MEPASSSEPKHSYSWWRDSHIVPKNSRWLQENLTDMDNKIKSMIKVIEEDADSFARRAEMYYKKRPELMKLVEEFYRAYRALAERYDRVTGALRQAHRTIAEAFPNQIQLVLPDEPPSELPDSGEEEKVTFAMPSYSDGNMESHEENDLFLSKEGWKHLACLLANEEAAQTEFAESFLNKSLNLKEDMGKNSELIKLQDEVSKLSKENKSLRSQITSESTRADKAETESQSFKDAVSKLKSEVESAFLQYQVSQKRVSYLEAEISQNREEVRHLNDEMSTKVSKLNIAEQRRLDLEIENKSLRLELEKFNEAVSRRFEEVSDLFKENQSLHNTVKSESMRADQAEAESCRLRDAISKLKSEMETALLQYKISQEKVFDLEAEISRAGDQFQKFNKELYIRSLKLNSSEEHCLLLLEENKSLQLTLDKFKMRVAKQEEDITTREEELSKLKQFMEDEHQQFKCARVKENISLQLDLNKFKLRNLTQEEELAAREKELDKLIQSLVDEGQRPMAAEMAHESMKKLYSQSEEKVRLLGLEIQSGTESLRRMELSKAGLEEEIKRLYDENHDLNEKSFSPVSKIVSLQDEMGSFRKSKRKAEDELKFHVDENKVLRQELSSLKNERNDLEDRHLELTTKIGEVNFNVVSLRAFVKNLLEDKKELKDACKKHADEEAFNLKNLRLMESISEKNFFLENSLSDATAELELLREKIKGLEKCCESLHNNSLSHESENSMLVSHVDAATQNIKKLSQKNTLIEESFADINVEFDGLRGKVKTLEESCQSLHYQNCYLIAENSNLVSQVGRIGQNIQSLENRLSTLEGKHVNVEKEKNLELHQLEELKDLLRSEKEEHENHIFLFRSQTSALNNQLYLLKEENHLKSKKLEEEEHKTAKIDIECFIMHKALYDITEKNLFLSDECHKCMEKLRCAEKLTLELKQDLSTHNNKLASLLDHNKKLLEWLHVMGKEDGETSNVVNEDMKQLNSQKIVDPSASNEETHRLCLEKSAFAMLFGQLGPSLAELRAQKNVIEQESEKENQEILVSHSKNHELMEVNKHMEGINDRNQQKKELMVEMETMHGELSDMLGVRCTFLGEIPKPFAESEYFSKKLYGSREQIDAREEENEAILEEAKFQEHLSCGFRSAEKSSEVDQLISDIHRLHGITDELRQNIREINVNMRVLQSDNMHLRDLVVNLETRNPVVLKDIGKLCNAFPELKPQIEAGKNQLEQRDMERFKKEELLVNLEGLVVELNKANVVKEGLEKNILSLSKDTVCKNDEIEILHQSNDKLVQEYSKLHKEAEAMRSREKNLASELQRERDESRCCEEESAAYLIEIHAAFVNELILRQTVAELMKKFESLEAHDSVQTEMPNGVISVGNAQREELMEKLDSLERENKELKTDLSAYVPIAVSLDNDILSSKTKQGNLLAPLQHKKLSQVRAKDHSSKVSAGILELKRLHAKVKVLQKAVTDTEMLLAQEEIVVDITNVDSETKNSKVRRSKDQLETIKKREIISDMRKSNAAGEEFKLLKDDQEVSKIKHEQMMKDIQLDHVLSRSRHGGDCSAETDEQSHVAHEPASGNDIEYHQIEIMEEERSDKPSSEVVLVKELSIDKIELPVNDTESHQEWGRRVSEALSSDAQRLTILQKSLEKLKKSIRVSEMSNQPSISKLNSVSEQLKESNGVIMQLIDINFTLAKIADSFSASQGCNEGRRQIWERVQKASEKIGGVEVELENMQCILSKLLEGGESKKAKALEGKSRIPLKDLIFRKRNDTRQKKRRLCACMRLKTKGD